jgi:hypothetical protein
MLAFHALRGKVNLLFVFQHTLRVEDLHPAGTATLRVGSGEVDCELPRRERQISGSPLDRYEPFLSQSRFDGDYLVLCDFFHVCFPAMQ